MDQQGLQSDGRNEDAETDFSIRESYSSYFVRIRSSTGSDREEFPCLGLTRRGETGLLRGVLGLGGVRGCSDGRNDDNNACL